MFTTCYNKVHVLWKHLTGGDVMSAGTLSPSGDILFVGSTDGFVYALYATTGKVKWVRPLSMNDPHCGLGYCTVRYSPTISHDGAMLFFGSFDWNVYALNTADGSIRWKYLTGNQVNSTPTLSHDGATLFVGSFDNNVYALKTVDGKLLWKYTPIKVKPDPRYGVTRVITASPTLSHDGTRLFIGSWDQHVYALKTSNGSLVWEHSACTSCPIITTATLSRDGTTLFVGQISGDQPDSSSCSSAREWRCGLAALDSSNGTLQRQYPTWGSPTTATLSADGATLFIGSTEGNVYALDVSSTALLWSYQTNDSIVEGTSATLSANGDTLFIGSWDKNVYAIDTSCGSLRWKYTTGKFLQSKPLLSADGATLFISADDGHVYALQTA